MIPKRCCQLHPAPLSSTPSRLIPRTLVYNDAKTNSRSLGEDVVTLYVGAKRKKFQVHKKLLCDRSSFQKAFSGDSNFKEATEGIMHLPEDDPATFDRIINWLYRDQLPVYLEKAEDRHPRSFHRSLIDMFLFAEKHCINVLANRAMDLMQDINLKVNTIPDLEEIRHVYSNSHDKSKLRLYVAAAACYLFSFGIDINYQRKLNRSDSKLAREIPDYGADFIQVQYELEFMLPEKPRVDPRKRSGKNGIDPCYFHTHSNGEVRRSGADLVFLYTCLEDYSFEFVVLTCGIDVSSKRRKVIQDLRKNICLYRWSDDGAAMDHALGDKCTLA
jgi:hypothetical protein